MDAAAAAADDAALASGPGGQLAVHGDPRAGTKPNPTAAAGRDGAGGDSKPEQHWPALDGLRAVAVLAVIMYHVGLLPGGYLGVDVFFVLSGFLITSLLINEWDKRHGTISFRDFYARRVLRLFPALGCVIVATSALAALADVAVGAGTGPYAKATLGAVPWVIVFMGNIHDVFHPGPWLLGALSQTWSLAVEEQFYLFWPVLFVLLMRRRLRRSRLALSLAVIAMAEMLYRAVMAHHGYGHDRIYYGTDTHSDGLLIGCALAFWLASRRSSQLSEMTGALVKGMTWLGAIVLVSLFVRGQQASAWVDVSAAVVASGAVVTGVMMSGAPASLRRFLSARYAVVIGRRSYGLYLWHGLVLATAEVVGSLYGGRLYPADPGERRLVFAVLLGAAIAVTFLAAELSYRFVELPALRVKRRFQGHAGASP